jgi:hypothetical protein
LTCDFDGFEFVAVCAMPWFGMRYAVVWYVLCRIGMRYAVLPGMGYAVVL